MDIDTEKQTEPANDDDNYEPKLVFSTKETDEGMCDFNSIHMEIRDRSAIVKGDQAKNFDFIFDEINRQRESILALEEVRDLQERIKDHPNIWMMSFHGYCLLIGPVPVYPDQNSFG